MTTVAPDFSDGILTAAKLQQLSDAINVALDRRIATSEITSDSATFTTTETQIASVVASLVSGRVYKVVMDFAFTITVDGVLRVQLREDTSGGTLIQLRDVVIDSSGSASSIHMECQFTAVATGSKTFVATGDVLAGGGTCNLNGDATFPSYMYVDHVSG